MTVTWLPAELLTTYHHGHTLGMGMPYFALTSHIEHGPLVYIKRLFCIMLILVLHCR